MKKLLLILCAGACSIAGTHAQQLRLTLDEAVALALSENPTIRIADLEVERYDYVKKETRGGLLPQLNASGNYTRSIVKQEMRGGISFGADNTFTATADLSVPLLAPSVYSMLKLNKAQIAVAVESARASRIDLVSAVKKAFYNILLAEQSLGVLLESEELARKTAEDTKVKFQNGLASEYDYLTAEVQLSSLQPSIIQTRNSIELAKLQLKMYLSIPETVEVNAVGRLDGMKDQVLAGGELSTDTSMNSDLRSLDLQAQTLKYQLRATNAARMPVVSAFGSVTYTGNDMADFRSMIGGDPGADGSGSGSQGGTAAAVSSSSNYFWQHPVSVGVQLSIPIFSGLKTHYRARQVKNQIAQLALQRDYMQRSVDVQLRQAINTLITARETMMAQEKTMAQSEKAYRIADTRFRAGAGTILELNSAQLAFTQSHLSYSQAIYDYLAAQAEYDRIAGREFDPDAARVSENGSEYK